MNLSLINFYQVMLFLFLFYLLKLKLAQLFQLIFAVRHIYRNLLLRVLFVHFFEHFGEGIYYELNFLFFGKYLFAALLFFLCHQMLNLYCLLNRLFHLNHLSEDYIILLNLLLLFFYLKFLQILNFYF